MRGPFGWAQNRGGAPSPAALRAATSPRTRGEVNGQLARTEYSEITQPG
jgi:hypothetical protein